MTTINTIEELRSLDVGEVINTTGANQTPEQWARTESGFQRNGAEVPIEFFTGLASTGTITVGPRYDVGNWYGTPGRSLYYMYDISEEGANVRFRYVYLYGEGADAQSYADQSVARGDSLPNFGPVVPRNQWNAAMRAVAVAGALLTAQWQENRRLSQQQSEREVQTTLDPDALRREGMETLAASFRSDWDGESFTESEVDAILSRHGLALLPVPQESIEVEVDITGYTLIDGDNLRDEVSSMHSVSVGDTRVSWTFTHTFGPFTVDADDCACSEVTRSMVEEWLDGEGFSYDDFSYTCDCENG